MQACVKTVKIWPPTCRSHSVDERNCSSNSSLDDRQCLLQGRGAKVLWGVGLHIYNGRSRTAAMGRSLAIDSLCGASGLSRESPTS